MKFPDFYSASQKRWESLRQVASGVRTLRSQVTVLPTPVPAEVDSLYLVPVDTKDCTLLISWLRRLKSKEEIKCHLSLYTLVTKRDRTVSALPISIIKEFMRKCLSNTLNNSFPPSSPILN